MNSQEKKYNIVLSDRLLQARKRAGISQAKLSELTGYSQGTISRYEKGKHKPATEFLIKASKIFNITLGELVGDNPPKKTKTTGITPEIAARLGFDPENFRKLSADEKADLDKAAAVEVDQILYDFVVWARNQAKNDPLFVGHLKYVLMQVKKRADEY